MIANIVSENKINVGPEFNIVTNIGDVIDGLPTLIVGYEPICELYGSDNITVLDRKISDNIFWTFKKNEKRNTYSSDLEDFIRYSYKKVVKDIKIVDFNPIQYSKKKNLNIFKKLLTVTDGISYESEKGVIYIYSNKIIFIIDLNLLEYADFDVIKIKKKIKDRSIVFLEGKEVLIEYNDYLERLDYDMKVLPFLYYIAPHD